MNWKDKLLFVASCVDTNDEIQDDFYLKNVGTKSDFISNLKIEYPFVTKDYIEFLELTDGADIAQCRFLEKSNFYSVSNSYNDIYAKETWMPFGYEAGGDPLLLHSSGKIALGDCKANKDTFVFLADDFSKFISEVIMGQKYASLFRVHVQHYNNFYKNELEDDPWLAFIVKNEWLKIN